MSHDDTKDSVGCVRFPFRLIVVKSPVYPYFVDMIRHVLAKLEA